MSKTEQSTHSIPIGLESLTRAKAANMARQHRIQCHRWDVIALARRGDLPGATGAVAIVNKCPLAEPADAGIGVQLNTLCAVGVANMRRPTAGASVDIADDMLKSAEARALVRLLLARLQVVIPGRLLKKTNIVRNFKHPPTLGLRRWQAALSEAFAAESSLIAKCYT